MESKNIRLNFIALSFWTSLSYFSQLRAILYCSNISSFFDIFMHGSWIPNEFIFFRRKSNIFVLLHFRIPVWILNMCKMQKTSLCLQNLKWQYFWNYGTQNNESLFQLQYITGISTKPVSQNKADAECSMLGRMKYNRLRWYIENTFAWIS